MDTNYITPSMTLTEDYTLDTFGVKKKLTPFLWLHLTKSLLYFGVRCCRYDDLIENHNTSLEKIRLLQEENNRLKTQCHELTQERNAVVNTFNIYFKIRSYEL